MNSQSRSYSGSMRACHVRGRGSTPRRDTTDTDDDPIRGVRIVMLDCGCLLSGNVVLPCKEHMEKAKRSIWSWK